MVEIASKEQIVQIQALAEQKIDVLKNLMDDNEYYFILKESMREIANDLGLELPLDMRNSITYSIEI